ncbi:MAG: hypothetical protein V4563_17505 [Pseudomonadota bacterium]
MSFHVPNKYRLLTGPLGSDASYGNNGKFFVKREIGAPFQIIASDGEGWEHVSVSLPSRCPTWEEMCFVKDMFWDGEDCVIQFHPPKSEYVNHHPYCLHLWRPTTGEIITPPTEFVGALA